MKTNEQAKHTPGPWSLGEENCGNGRNIYHFRDYIGHSCGYEAKPGSNQRTLSQGEADANARIMVSAPDLLEACEAAILWIETPTRPWAETADTIRAAIRKAKGE